MFLNIQDYACERTVIQDVNIFNSIISKKAFFIFNLLRKINLSQFFMFNWSTIRFTLGSKYDSISKFNLEVFIFLFLRLIPSKNISKVKFSNSIVFSIIQNIFELDKTFFWFWLFLMGGDLSYFLVLTFIGRSS